MLRQILKRPITDYLVQQATHFVAITVDGKGAEFKIARVVGMDEGVHVELTCAAVHARHVRFADRHKDRRITVPVEVALDGLELAKALPPQPFVFADHPLDLDLK